MDWPPKLPRGIPRAKCALGMTAKCARTLPFEEVHFVGEDRFTVAEEGNDNTETDGGFGSGVRDDEQGEDLTSDIAEDAREENEVDVDGVENQLNGHQDDDDVAASHDADTTDEEERQTEEEIMGWGHHDSSVLFLFLAITTEPTMATSRRTLAISKGRR